MRADDGLARWPAQARFAIYYAPPRDSAWWRAGCAWLGRDPESGAAGSGPAASGPADSSSAEPCSPGSSATDTGAADPRPQPPALTRPLADLTVAPARYGWHGTLMPPFRLAAGVTPADLLAQAQQWAGRQRGFALAVTAAALGRFVALRPATDADEAAMRALAEDALRTFTPLRATPSARERDARRAQPLTPRQQTLLDAWGYPYVLDEFRFHMTLSDSLDDPAERGILLDWWRAAAPGLGPLPATGAALFVEPAPGAPFVLWRRLPFDTLRTQP
jgi:hypothetical protein